MNFYSREEFLLLGRIPAADLDCLYRNVIALFLIGGRGTLCTALHAPLSGDFGLFLAPAAVVIVLRLVLCAGLRLGAHVEADLRFTGRNTGTAASGSLRLHALRAHWKREQEKRCGNKRCNFHTGMS